MNNKSVKVTPVKFPSLGLPVKQPKRTNIMTVKLKLDTTELKERSPSFF